MTTNTFTLSNLDGKNGFKITDIHASQSYVNILGIGDVNNDNHNNIDTWEIIGAAGAAALGIAGIIGGVLLVKNHHWGCFSENDHVTTPLLE